MKNITKIALAMSVFIAGSLIYGWPYLQMEMASSAYYTEEDIKKYEYYTPPLLKNMPRISEDYSFEFGNVSGPEAHVYTVRFNGVSEAKQIQDYLTGAGYTKQPECDVKAECWRAPGKQEVVTLIKYNSPDSVVVQMYWRGYGE